MAIVQAVESDIGYYEYKCEDGTWRKVNITNIQPLGSSGHINVLYLKPNQSLRFYLKKDAYWTPDEAVSKASLSFLAWDMTNGGTCGVDKVNVSTARSARFLSKFEDPALLKKLRRGCDGIPGSVGQFDACGECEGDNSTCTDCAGVVNGKAVRGKDFLF